MKFAPVRVTAPAALPVSAGEAKAHLRVPAINTTDDAYIASCVAAAVERLDGYAGLLGRCIVTQEWRQKFEGWPASDFLRLPFADVDPASVVISYLDTLGDDQVVPATHYEALHDAQGCLIRLRLAFTSPSLEDDRAAPVSVTFEAGYGAAVDVPAPIKAAILLMVGDLYENREDTVVGNGLDVRPLPRGVDALLAPYRRVGV